MTTSVDDTAERAGAFAKSLPSPHRDNYPSQLLDRHAELAAGRVGPFAIEVFERHPEQVGICIIADDRPGLLSRISHGIVLCGLDVIRAEAFTRYSDMKAEAVDLFWLRKLEGGNSIAPGPTDLERLHVTLRGIFDGTLEPGSARIEPGLGPGRSNSRVSFIEDDMGALGVLEIETEDRSGLLHLLSTVLFEHGLQIVRSEVRTVSSRVRDRFHILELDGSPVSPARRLEIQVAILTAVEPAKRLSQSVPLPA